MVQAQGGGGGGGTQGSVTAPRRPSPLKQANIGISGIRAIAGSGGGNSSAGRPVGASGSGGSHSIPVPVQQFQGGGGGMGGGGGGLGSTSSGQVTPKVIAPSMAQFLGTDSTYLQQKSALDKARSDYLAQQGQSKTQYLTNYTQDASSLSDNRKNAFGDLENDFASRGLLQSGLYADGMANLTKDFDSKTSQLEQAKAQFLSQLTNDQTNFQSEQGLTLTRAQQEAAARRAAQYGV